MAATVTQVNNYISSIRSGIGIFADEVALKEKLGHKNLFCRRQKVILAAAYLQIVLDYFAPYIEAGVDDDSYDTNNFFTTAEIRDVMQHINNVCGTFYMLDL